MAKKPVSLDYWRNYFGAANSDIFGIIDHAIMVAASDCPKDFKLRRDRIAERLFSCGLKKCSGCDRVEVSGPSDDGDCDDYVDVVGLDDDDDDDDEREHKESKVNSNTRDDDENLVNQVSNISYVDAEALTDEIEEESQIVSEVFRIKETLLSSEEQSDSVMFDSLRRLQLMCLTVDTLKATEIGKAVNGFRKHGAKEIRNLAKTLIDGWKDLVDEWVSATAQVAPRISTEGTPDSVNPSVLDEEEGLPSPPLDELVFFTSQPTAMELSGFFDGMDDDGNPRNSGGFSTNRETGRKLPTENQNAARRKQNPQAETSTVAKENKSQQQLRKKQEGVAKPSSKPPVADSGPGRPPRAITDHRASNVARFQQKPDGAALQNRQVSRPQEKLKGSIEDAVQVKLEATKRKLQERYQQAENAKRQRTIQVMELQDLPKQSLGHRNPHVKPGNHNRHWAHGRR